MRSFGKRPARYGFLLSLVLTAAACGSGVRQPEVRLDGLRLGGLGLDGGTLFVQVHVGNPNRFRIEAGEVTYVLDLREPWRDDDRWLKLATGTFRDGIRVEGRDSAVVEIPVRFRYREAGPVLMTILDSGTVDYRVSGTVKIEKPVRRDLAYRRIGTFALAGGE